MRRVIPGEPDMMPGRSQIRLYMWRNVLELPSTAIGFAI
jgi:hypothetical protein